MEDRDGHLALVFAFIAGALCGAIAGLLLAPEKGEETRKKIKEIGEKVRKKGGRLVEKAQDLIEEGKEKVERFVEGEKEALEDKKSIITKAVEAGKKAMKEEVEKIKAKA